MQEKQQTNGDNAALGSRKLKRETIQNWIGTAYNYVEGRFTRIQHLVAEHRSTIEALVGKYCPDIATNCEDLQPLQKQIDGYFLLIQGEANSQAEQELIAQEEKEYRVIVQKIQRIFSEGRLSIGLSLIDKNETAIKLSALPVSHFKTIWDKYLHAPIHRMLLWDRRDGIIAVMQKGLRNLQTDWPLQTIDNMVYIEHLHEQAENFLDEIDEMIKTAQDDEEKIFHCFNLLAGRRRTELDQAMRKLSPKNMETFQQMLEIVGTPPPGIDPAVSIKRLVDRVRPMMATALTDLGSLVDDFRRGITDVFAETELLINQGYSLKTRQDIVEPMGWRSEFLEEIEEELAKREEKKSKAIWFKSDRLKDDIRSKWKRFTESKHCKQYEKAEADLMAKVRHIVQTVPPLIRRADIERLQNELTSVTEKYNDMIASRVTPYAGKAVAKVLLNRFDAICKGVVHKGDILLWSTDIGRNIEDVDQQEVIENTEPLTPEEIERILDPFMMRLYRVHAEGYTRLGHRSKAKGNAKGFEMTARLCLRDLPERIVSLEQLFTLITVPVDTNQGAFEAGQRQRLHEGGSLDCIGNKLDEISLVVCAREYRRFTDVIRKRTWNVRRNFAAQGKALTPGEEAPKSRKGEYALVTKERMMEEMNENLRNYQLQNGMTDLLGKLEPDLQDSVIMERDIAVNRIAILFEAQGNQISYDELLVLKSGIIAECDKLRRAVPDIRARDYFDLFEESYRCVIWHIENTMEFGATVLKWDKQDELMAAVQGAQGRTAMTGPQEREFELADLSNPGISTSLHFSVSNGFSKALARYPINAEIFVREVRRAFSTLEKELPLVLGFGHVDRAARLTPLLTQCRDACIAIIETGEASIGSIDVFDQLFGRLGWIFDQLQNRFKGVMHGFLAQRFIALRKRLQEQTLQRAAQEEMRQTLSNMDDPRINAGQYETFFIQFAQNVLTDRCRQFLYSCITPAMNAEQIGQVGAAINRAVQTVMAFLADRIRMKFTQTRGPISLAEIQQCFVEASQIDIATLGLPPSIDERFRTQVLNFLAQDLSRVTTPEGLIGAHGIPSITEDYSSLIQREVSSAQRVQNREALIPLRQTAREQHAQCLRYIEAIKGGLTELQIDIEGDAAGQRLHQLMEGLAALRFSLYAPSETQTVAGNELHQAIAHLEALQTTLTSLYGQIQRTNDDFDTQRAAMETIRNLTDTLKGLLHFLYKKP